MKSIRQKAKAYDEAIERAKYYYDEGKTLEYADDIASDIFPELAESEDKKIRKEIINYLEPQGDCCGNKECWIAWLEKQGKETSWKPSKEEMDVLYGLAYITNQYDEHKEEVITRLYQDLKREFFNGSSYENMFPTNTSTEDDVRRRSTIQVLEYARSLDTYNQYGKADIDKNIAWLEKQGEQKSIWHNEDEEPQRGSLILLIMQSGTPIVAKIIEPNHTFNHGERWAYIDDLLEKQEPKPTTIDIDKMVNDYANNKERGNEEFGKPVNCMIRAYRQGLNDSLSALNLENKVKVE